MSSVWPVHMYGAPSTICMYVHAVYMVIVCNARKQGRVLARAVETFDTHNSLPPDRTGIVPVCVYVCLHVCSMFAHTQH